MSLSDIGSWASIIGFILTMLTFLLAFRVEGKVNAILKSKSDRTYFDKKVKNVINGLEEVQSLAEEEKDKLLFSLQQYSKINTAVQLVGASWDILYAYENRFSKKMKIHRWNKKFKRITEMYNMERVWSNREVLGFLEELIMFLEKEMQEDGR